MEPTKLPISPRGARACLASSGWRAPAAQQARQRLAPRKRLSHARRAAAAARARRRAGAAHSGAPLPAAAASPTFSSNTDCCSREARAESQARAAGRRARRHALLGTPWSQKLKTITRLYLPEGNLRGGTSPDRARRCGRRRPPAAAARGGPHAAARTRALVRPPQPTRNTRRGTWCYNNKRTR